MIKIEVTLDNKFEVFSFTKAFTIKYKVGQ
jgi:hypothetical protein